MSISYARHQFPPAIRHALWLYLRFSLSFRAAVTGLGDVASGLAGSGGVLAWYPAEPRHQLPRVGKATVAAVGSSPSPLPALTVADAQTSKSVTVTWYDRVKEEKQSSPVPRVLLMKAPRLLWKRRPANPAS